MQRTTRPHMPSEVGSAEPSPGPTGQKIHRKKITSRAGSSVIMVCCFQAEDGIRDYKVTGVQTCALPIFCLADLLRPDHRPDPVFLLHARYLPPLPGDARGDCTLVEPGARGFDGGLRKGQVLPGDSPSPGHRPAIPALF